MATTNTQVRTGAIQPPSDPTTTSITMTPGPGTSFASGTNSATNNPTNLSADQQSAKSTIQAMLDQWGLGSLGDWAWNKYLNGESIDAITYDIRQTDAYKQRFPGMAQLTQSGHAISEADYIAKENSDIQLMHAYGLDSFATTQELGNLIGNQVSTAELQNRLEDYKAIALQLPQEVRDYARRELGLNTGDLMGVFLDPTKSEPILRQKIQAAQVGGAAAIAGFNNISPDVAARLAGLGNTDFGSTLDKFQKAALLRPLDQSLPGQAASVVNEQDLINAEVGGDAASMQGIQQEMDRRKAAFKDQESVATTQAGAVGLAQTNV